MPDRRRSVDKRLGHEMLDGWRIDCVGRRQVDMAHLTTCATEEFFGVATLTPQVKNSVTQRGIIASEKTTSSTLSIGQNPIASAL